MSIVETALVFVGIPALIFGLLAALVLAPGAARRPRYRPGEPWDYAPVWYVPQPQRDEAPSAGHPALEGAHRPALTAGAPVDYEYETGAQAGAEPAVPVRTARGGVHDTW